jgi:hypothetical protein
MKLIIIIQSLIIIAGAYYVYTLSHTTEVIVESAPTIKMNIEPGMVREGYTPPTENPPVDPVKADSEVTGHSDVGMEFPIPDENIEVR